MALTKLNNNGIAGVTALPSSIALGDMTLVSSATASGSATIDFTLGDYKEYQFYFVNIHPANNAEIFTFNGSTDNGSNYNVTKTSTFFYSYHNESDTETRLDYEAGQDLAQSTNYQDLTGQIGNDNDQNASGYLHIFNPSSTTYVKHFIGQSQITEATDYSFTSHLAGYMNTTSAINAIQFKFRTSNNIDSGTILMYGIN